MFIIANFANIVGASIGIRWQQYLYFFINHTTNAAIYYCFVGQVPKQRQGVLGGATGKTVVSTVNQRRKPTCRYRQDLNM